MIIRNMTLGDIESLEKIHRQYTDEFSINEFNTENFIGLLVAEEDGIIVAGGIRHIPELVIVTDKTKPVKVRRNALLSFLQASEYIAKRAGHLGLHAYIQDKDWLRQLVKYGFNATKGTSLVYDLNRRR